MRKWFLDLTLRTKWNTPCERAWKTVPKNGVASCAHFCLRSLVPFERCESLHVCELESDNCFLWAMLCCLYVEMKRCCCYRPTRPGFKNQILGTTNAFIMAKAMKSLKFSDRFFYEHGRRSGGGRGRRGNGPGKSKRTSFIDYSSSHCLLPM